MLWGKVVHPVMHYSTIERELLLDYTIQTIISTQLLCCLSCKYNHGIVYFLLS